MAKFLPFVVSGILLGLFAGASPGPLLALVITETMKYGKKEGIKVAFAPLVTDIPMLVILLLFFSKIANYGIIPAVISFLGAVFVTYLGLENLRVKHIETNAPQASPKSFRLAVTANALSPHPYLFWITIGMTILFNAARVSFWAPIVYIVVMYIFLVGTKITVAVLVDKFHRFLPEKAYIIVLRVFGVMLCGFGLFFIYDGLKLLKII